MKHYPRLTEMGISNPQQIEKFAIYSTDSNDILRIVYKRKKGSVLPVSKKYKFDRVKKSIMVDSGTRQTGVIFESADAFREALHELGELKAEKDLTQDIAALINEEIRLMEEDIALRLEYIKALTRQI